MKEGLQISSSGAKPMSEDNAVHQISPKKLLFNLFCLKKIKLWMTSISNAVEWLGTDVWAVMEAEGHRV